jgi:hypothetical protein
MKRSIVFLSLLFSALSGFSQAQEGSVTYQKKQHSAAVIELPYSTSIVNDALNDYMSKKGRSKSNVMKGFTAYRNTQPVTGDSSNADMYFKTERKSKTEKDITVVSLLVMPGSSTSKDPKLHYMNMETAKNYLNTLSEAVVAYDIELTIKDQNNALIRAEAKYKSLSDDGRDMQRKKEDLDKKITENQNQVKAQMKDLENQKAKLAQWVSQRKSN